MRPFTAPLPSNPYRNHNIIIKMHALPLMVHYGLILSQKSRPVIAQGQSHDLLWRVCKSASHLRNENLQFGFLCIITIFGLLAGHGRLAVYHIRKPNYESNGRWHLIRLRYLGYSFWACLHVPLPAGIVRWQLIYNAGREHRREDYGAVPLPGR